LFATQAFAADMAVKAAPPPAAPPSTWTGWYVGANIGWGWAKGGDAQSCINSTTGTNAGCAVVPDSALSANGVLGGGQIGYNWQANSVVVGLEADIQGANIKGSNFINAPGAVVPFTYSTSESINWFGTVRPRVGVLATPNVLLYVTGGLIYGGVKTSQNLFFPGSGFSFPASTSTTRTGGTAGGGIEWMLAPRWSAKVEGLWYSLGNVTTAATQVPVPSIFTDFKTFGFHSGMVRGGINYHFN
jgi:outer membrane immunogenic protein